jgi:hypothetical protein
MRASRKVLAMMDSGATEKLEKLVRLLSSDKDHEVLAAARAIMHTLSNTGSDIHELAERIKGDKLSEAEMQRIYDAGVQEGKDVAAAVAGFSSTEGPSYYEMAKYCVERDDGRLSPKERGFVEDMVLWCARREPSEKQGKWLHVLYVKLGHRR